MQYASVFGRGVRLLLVIGSFFVVSCGNALGAFSFGSHDFWNVVQLPVAFADDHEDHDEEDEREHESGHEDHDEDERREYVRPSTGSSGPSTTAPTTTNPASPSGSATVVPAPAAGSSASPTTAAPAQKQVCTTVYDTVTNASGTKQQVPRQSCSMVDVVSTPVAPVAPASPVTPTPALARPAVTESVPAPVSQTGALPVDQVRVPVQSVQSVSGTFRGTGSYVYPGGSIPYSVALTFSSGTIVTADLVSFSPSGNNLFSKSDALYRVSRLVGKKIGDPTISIDSVSGASGTSKALNDAVGNAIVAASQSSVASQSAEGRSSSPQQSLSGITASGSTVSAPISSADFKPIQYVAPNGKKYVIHRIQSGLNGYPKYLFERADGTFSTKTFSSLNSVTDAIDSANSYERVTTHLVPNGKEYAILRAYKSGKYRFERADGTRSTTDFDTESALATFLDANNPAPVIVKKPTVKKPVAKKSPVKKTVTVAVSPSKKPQPAASAAPVAVAPSKPAAPAYKPAAPAATVAKPDTVTKAS